MATRDQELDDLEKQLREPHIEKPDELSIADGSSCWLDMNRACGADCRAYDPGVRPAEGPEVCTILGGMMDVVEALQGFVSVGAITRKKHQDHARTAAASVPVPDPTGGKKAT